MEADAGRRGGGPEDHISRLPDEILHSILLRLPSTAEVARTSLLSRRWRRVWAHIPELVLGSYGPAPACSPLLDSVDAALHAYAAPTVRQLNIDLVRHGGRSSVPAQRVASWLRFASQRLAGRLILRLPARERARWGEEKEEIFLPICERTTEIRILFSSSFVFRPPPTGSFTALTKLTILAAAMDGCELGRVVSLQCPCLESLMIVVELVTTFEVSICSDSLKDLHYYGKGRDSGSTRKLVVAAPRLTEIYVSLTEEAYIVAPKLEKVSWTDDPYDPSRHQFVEAGRHLQYLSIRQFSTQLMHRFDTVSELELTLSIPEGREGYLSFLKNTDKLPICETLCIYTWGQHAFVRTTFHLLMRCSCIRKLKLDHGIPSPKNQPCTSECPCHLPESYMVHNATFDSLEEIEMFNFRGSDAEERLIKLLLSRCNAKTLRRVNITTMESGT